MSFSRFIFIIGFSWLITIAFTSIVLLIGWFNDEILVGSDAWSLLKENLLWWTLIGSATLMSIFPLLWKLVHELSERYHLTKLSAATTLTIQQKYREAKQHFQTKTFHGQRSAIIALDTLLEFTFKKLGYQNSLGNTLKNHPELFSNLDGVWRAHKLRNKIVHELEFEPTSGDLQDALHGFTQAFHDLGIKV